MKRQKTLTSRFNPKYPVRSLLNYISVRASYAAKTKKVVGYPSKLLIEPNSFCNLKCPLCPTGRGTLNREDGYMSLAQFATIIDEVKPYTTHIELAGYGEPGMNPDIYKMIRYAADAGIFVNMHSNVNLIDTPEKVHSLVTSGLGHLTLSVDGATQKTYAKYRVGGNVERVIENARAIMTERRRLGLTSPYVTMQVVVTKVNENEIEDIRRIAEEIGVDHFGAKKASLALTRKRGVKEIAGGIVDHWMPSKMFNRHGRKIDLMDINSCDWLYKRAFIYWNGDVTTCCHDASYENKMGNIFEAGSFKKVWNGEAYQAIRKQVNTNIRAAEPICSVCPDRVAIPEPAPSKS